MLLFKYPWIWATLNNPREPKQFCLEGDLQEEFHPETRVVLPIPEAITKQLQRTPTGGLLIVMSKFRKPRMGVLPLLIVCRKTHTFLKRCIVVIHDIVFLKQNVLNCIHNLENKSARFASWIIRLQCYIFVFVRSSLSNVKHLFTSYFYTDILPVLQEKCVKSYLLWETCIQFLQVSAISQRQKLLRSFMSLPQSVRDLASLN